MKEVIWKYSTDGATFNAVSSNPIATEAIILMYEVITECEDTLESVWFYNTATSTTVDTACYQYVWEDSTYTASFTATKTYTLTNGCDSIANMDVTILTGPTILDITQLTGTPVISRGQTIDLSAWVAEIEADLAAQAAANPALADVTSIAWEWSVDGINWAPLTSNTITNTEAVSIRYSIITECGIVAPVGQYNNTARDTLTVEACNFYTWSANDSTYNVSTIDSVALVSATNAACDSISYLNLTVNNPIYENLEAVSKYGNRLLMVNLNSINATTGWNLDPVTGAQYVKWYQVADPEDQMVGEGYYLTKDGEPLVGEFYAVITIPGEGNNCGHIGITNTLVCEAAAGAPMLMPSMAKPEETITVYNLNPEIETTIRIYTTDGLIVRTYTTSGQDSFQMKANADNGFYLVELTGENMKSTLRYIVK